MNYEEECVPYKKRKGGNISKAKRKSDHKHSYDRVIIFEYNFYNKTYYMGVWYCSICGKIGEQTETKFPWGWRMSKEDWQKKYPNAVWKKLDDSLSWININNINEVL